MNVNIFCNKYIITVFFERTGYELSEQKSNVMQICAIVSMQQEYRRMSSRASLVVFRQADLNQTDGPAPGKENDVKDRTENLHFSNSDVS